MKYVILAAAAVILAACDTGQSALNTALPKYQDKPISLVFQRWGMPDQSTKGDGGTIYQWRAQDRTGICRLEAHAADPLRGNAEPKLIGLRFVGEDSVCASWFRMLK